MADEFHYKKTDLKQFGELGQLEETMTKKFFEYYNQVFSESSLSAREKNLIALAVAHTVQCPYCIDAFTASSLENGTTEQQMLEAVHVAAAIRGGASLVHGVQMMNKAKKLGM